jgi:hypothetical protein
MDRIYIIDNCLNETDLFELMEYVNSQNSWKFGHRSGTSERVQTKFWSIMDLTDYITIKLTAKFKNMISSKFKINRNYMHIQTFGQDGCYHTDDSADNSFTICLYLTDISNTDLYNAKGEFLIKIPNTKHIVSIDTHCNRCVMFPSNYLHKGMGYNPLYSNKRVCITWKCTEII